MTNIKLPKVNIKGKPYTLVKDRIGYLREYYDGRFEIKTNYNYIEATNTYIVQATLVLWNEDHTISNSYNGLSQAKEGGMGVNATSALENAETSAVGRACANAGIGTDDAMASADEIIKATITPTKPVETNNLSIDTKKYKQALEEIKDMLDLLPSLQSEDERIETVTAAMARIQGAEKQGLLKIPEFAPALIALRQKAEKYITK